MPVLVYTESEKGNFKKSAFEVASYASELAKVMGTDVIAISVNADSPAELGAFGITRVLNAAEPRLAEFNAGERLPSCDRPFPKQGQKCW